MWTKVTRKYGPGPVTPTRAVPAVRRSPSNPNDATLVFPEGWVTSEKCDIYSDGSGRLAYRPCKAGAYKVRKNYKAGSRASFVTIPSEFIDRIPYGTTDVTLTSEGGMFVLDLNSIRKLSVAAE